MPRLLEAFLNEPRKQRCHYRELPSKHRVQQSSTTLFAPVLCKKRLKRKEWREPFAEPADLFLPPCSLMFLE